MSREFYETARLSASLRLNRKTGVPNMPLNPRVEEEQLFAKQDGEDPEGDTEKTKKSWCSRFSFRSEDFVLPEELDQTKKLPRERNLMLEAAAAKVEEFSNKREKKSKKLIVC